MSISSDEELHEDFEIRFRKNPIWFYDCDIPGWKRIEIHRKNGKSKGKVDVEYYTPFPELRHIRSMKQCIYFYPKINWDHFNYNTGKNEVEYKNPRVKDQLVWWDKDSKRFDKMKEKMIAKETKLREKGEQLKNKSRNSASVWDLLFISQGKVTGLMQGCPNDFKSDVKKASVKTPGKKRKTFAKKKKSCTKPKAKQQKSNSPITDIDNEKYSKKVDDVSVKNQTFAVKETVVAIKKCNMMENVSRKSGEKETNEEFGVGKVTTLQPQATKAVKRPHFWTSQSPEITMALVSDEKVINDQLNEENQRNPKPYLYGNKDMVYAYGGNLFEIMKKSIDMDIPDQCFLDNRNLLQHYSLKCDPIEDSSWRFLWIKDALVTNEVKKLRKSFFEDLIASGQFKNY